MEVQNMQQYIAEQIKIQTINMEMQPMKQVVGIQIALSLWLRTPLSSNAEALTTVLPAQVCFSSTASVVALMGAPARFA